MYPFSVPIGSSYTCQIDSTATVAEFSNPNRFVQMGNVTNEEAIKAIANGEGSPVVQFTGIHVSVCKEASSIHCIYDCI